MRWKYFIITLLVLALMSVGLVTAAGSDVTVTTVKNEISPAEAAEFDLRIVNGLSQSQRFILYSLGNF